MIQMRRSEYQILRDLGHPNIVRALDFFCSARTAVLVLSYHPGGGSGTLSQAIRASSCSRFSEEVAKPLCRMLFAAVDYLHQHRIVHRDVKADNILDLSDLHLADFNTARSLLDGGSLTMTGTVEYSAPEVLAGESPSELHDIWGAGLCMHMMLTGSLPRRPTKYPSLAAFHEAVTSKPVDCQGVEWSDVSQDAKDTVRRCLAVSREERPAAMTVLKMPWLANGGSDLVTKFGRNRSLSSDDAPDTPNLRPTSAAIHMARLRCGPLRKKAYAGEHFQAR
eukprot:s3171_g2.t1